MELVKYIGIYEEQLQFCPVLRPSAIGTLLTSNVSMYISETESTGDCFWGHPRPRRTEKERAFL